MVRILEDLWQTVLHTQTVTTDDVAQDPILGGTTDGYPHRRTPGGYCLSCGAHAGAMHRRVEPSRAPDAPIYYSLITVPIEERALRHRLIMEGYGPKTTDAAVRFWKRYRERKTE